jgi:flagellar basal-body rod protein FlgF
MDKMIYVAMNGASHAMYRQSLVSHNLANINTPGFRAELHNFRALEVFGPGERTRAYAVAQTPGSDFSPGVLQSTGRDLDVAVITRGWIAVEGADGKEAYTRNGSLMISQAGLLQTRNGFNVLGEGGPISIPNDTEVIIAKDGTVSTLPAGQAPTNVGNVGRIKLVNPPEEQLVRGEDGLFRMKDGNPALPDANVALTAGSLESSNVSAVESIVNLITQSRHFDLQIKLLQNADANERKADSVLSLTA